MDKILVVGDIHAHWVKLNRLIDIERPDIILQVGDLGYWPHIYPMKHVDMKNTVMYFCPGNHEDWIALNSLEDLMVHPHVFYMPKGSMLTLASGHNVLFMGGAYSVDKEFRVPGYSWFPDEMISAQDMENLPDDKIDIIISHTSPLEFGMKGNLPGMPQVADQSQDYLSQLLEKYSPSQWFFGHWHTSAAGRYKNTSWRCLDTSESKYWWTTLEL